MKYVIYVLILAFNADGDIERTEFTVDMSSRQSCIEAVEDVEKKVIADWPNATSLSVECRPLTRWDEPMTFVQFEQDEELVAKQ